MFDCEHLSNEWFVVRHSGEIPEIALNSAIFYLTEEDEGPKLVLSEDDVLKLKQAAAERFKEIVVRDITHDNKGKSIYRGIERTIINWNRFEAFCQRQQFCPQTMKGEVSAQLLIFLATESCEAEKCGCRATLNCSFEELYNFTSSLGLEESSLPENIQSLCKD